MAPITIERVSKLRICQRFGKNCVIQSYCLLPLANSRLAGEKININPLGKNGIHWLHWFRWDHVMISHLVYPVLFLDTRRYLDIDIVIQFLSNFG